MLCCVRQLIFRQLKRLIDPAVWVKRVDRRDIAGVPSRAFAFAVKSRYLVVYGRGSPIHYSFAALWDWIVLFYISRIHRDATGA